MLMTGRLNLAKALTFGLLALMVLSTVPFPAMALDVSDEYNITDSDDWARIHRIADDSDGNYHLVYNEVGSDDFVMYKKLSPTGDTLAGPTRISPSNIDGSYDHLAISVDSSDRVHIAYGCQGQNDDARNVYYTQLSKDGNVNVNFKNVAPTEDTVFALDIDTDSSGNSYIVFHEQTDPPTIQWMKLSSSGAISRQPKEISGDLGLNGVLQFPRLGVSASGFNFIAWQQQDNAFVQSSLYYTQLTSSGSVEIDPVEVVSNPVYDLIYLEADSDSSDNLHLLYTQNAEVHWAIIDDSGSLDAEREVATSLLGQTSSSDIDVAPNDDVAISYGMRDNIINAPWLPYIRIWDDSDDSLGDAELLYDGTASTVTPRVAAGSVVTAIAYGRNDNVYMVTVTEAAANNPPVADLTATPLDPKVDETVSFDGSDSSDPDDGDFVDEYNFEYGDGASSGWRTSSSATHAYTSAGTYTARLRVRDSNGLESNNADTVTITVTSGTTNKAPTAVLGVDKTTADVGEDVTFDGTQSFDTDGVVTSYLFSYGDGASTGWESSATSTHAYTNEGVYTATMKVRDDKGEESDMDAVTISVVDTNEKPTATIVSIDPNPAMQFDEITFTGSGTDSDGTIKAYSWESDRDGIIGDSATFTFNGLADGTHSIIFKVQDDDDVWSDADTETVVVTANRPFVITDLTEFDGQVYTDTLVEFRVEYKDPDDDRPLEFNIRYSKGNDWKSVELKEVEIGDTDYTDGKEYYFSKKFNEGTWKYTFEFRNANNAKKSSPVAEFKVKEAPGPLPGWETGPSVGAILLAAIVVALVMRRREGTPSKSTG
jgi:PKD repeat protein